MVNSHTMNIDVREYLRINPISVHEPTLSQEDTDCFMLFQHNGQYDVLTQKTLFWEFYKTIFGNLVTGDSTNPAFDVIVDSDGGIHWNPNAHLTDDQFKDYVRRAYCEGVQGQLNE